MSEKNKKQFAVWMDSQHATILGKVEGQDGKFTVIGHEKSAAPESNSNENSSHNIQRDSLHKLFKQITSHMQNVDEIHVTGTGTAQEQFIKYLSETPQYKNVVSTISTSEKMSEDNLIDFATKQFK